MYSGPLTVEDRELVHVTLEESRDILRYLMCTDHAGSAYSSVLERTFLLSAHLLLRDLYDTPIGLETAVTL